MNDSERQNTSCGRKNREQKERDKVIIESRKEFFKCLLSDTEGHTDTARVIYTLCILTFTSPAVSQQICTLFPTCFSLIGLIILGTDQLIMLILTVAVRKQCVAEPALLRRAFLLE